MGVRTLVMTTALGEMKKNKGWIGEASKFFNCNSRDKLAQLHLTEVI